MYKTRKITTTLLSAYGACLEGMDWFRKNFPRGLTISNSQEEMIDLVLGLLENDVDLYNLNWFVCLDLFHDKYIGSMPYGVSYSNGTRMSHHMEHTPDDYPTLAVLLSDHFLLK